MAILVKGWIALLVSSPKIIQLILYTLAPFKAYFGLFRKILTNKSSNVVTLPDLKKQKTIYL
nr:hypothetical protein [Mucilaginibacter sp. E4BP6]